jgi:hypothetical protein
VRAAIPSLFRGRWSYVTTCRACGRESAASASLTDYYEMPVQVRWADRHDRGAMAWGDVMMMSRDEAVCRQD